MNEFSRLRHQFIATNSTVRFFFSLVIDYTENMDLVERVPE